jgi:ABC-type uncharacterized transport system permease subunit
MTPAQSSDLVLAATASCYAVSSAFFFTQLAGKAPRGQRWAKPLLGVAAALHLGWFLLTAMIARACPVEGIHQATSLMALAAAGIFLLLGRFWRVDVIGAFLAPVCLTALLAARFVGVPDVTPPVRTAVLPLHVTAILLASALFAISSALAATYLLQEKQLKKKKAVGLLQRLPPLDVLDRASHKFLLAGFPLLTIGILTGLVWIGRIGESEAGLLRQLLAYAAWILFAAVLLMRAVAGWRGRRAAWGTILGLGCVVLVFVIYLVRGVHAVKGG